MSKPVSFFSAVFSSVFEPNTLAIFAVIFILLWKMRRASHWLVGVPGGHPLLNRSSGNGNFGGFSPHSNEVPDGNLFPDFRSDRSLVCEAPGLYAAWGAGEQPQAQIGVLLQPLLQRGSEKIYSPSVILGIKRGRRGETLYAIQTKGTKKVSWLTNSQFSIPGRGRRGDQKGQRQCEMPSPFKITLAVLRPEMGPCPVARHSNITFISVRI
jgi:hypothetical protein